MRNLSIEVEEGETPLLIKTFFSWKLCQGREEAFRQASSQTSGLRRSSFRSLCHSYLHKPPEMTCCFCFFIVSSIYCPLLPWPPVHSLSFQSLLQTSVVVIFLVIANKDDGEMFEWISARGQHPSSAIPSLLGLFFAVNYSLELITFFFFFVIVLVLMFFLSFKPRLSYSCHLRDCLLLLTFSIPLT